MKKLFWLSCVTAAVCLLLVSGTVFAEGEEPPAAAPECVDCGAAAVTEAPTDDPVIVENIPGSDYQESELDEEDPAKAPVEGMETDPSGDVQEPVAQVSADETAPDAAQDLEIVLLNEQGEPLDMASQETAELLVIPDPYFYVAGVKIPHTSIMEAVNHIVTLGVLPDDGMIYVENNTYLENVSINGVENLILSGLKGLVSENGSEFTTIDGSVTLNGLTAGFTLKGFTINGAVSIVNNPGNIVLEDLVVSNPAGIGIVIGARESYHHGTAMLKDVRSNHNSSHGATIFTTGNITVTNSSFDGNGGDGLRVESSAGTITIKGVTASNNGARGIYNLNTFTKTFTLQHVQANNNGLYGLDMGFSHSTLGTATGAFFADTIYAQNNNLNIGSAISGFKVTTNGAITLKNILIENTKNGNGLYLLHYSTTPVVLQNVTSRENDKNGIDIGTRGNVSLTSVKSTGNKGDGARITNWGSDGIGTITITSPASAGTAGANDFSNNLGVGLYLGSNNNILLTNLDASGNGTDGLWVDTPGNLTINKTLPNWANGFNRNGGNGIYTRVDGNVSLMHCEASDNGNSGVHFNSTAKSATITGGRFDNNGDYGLNINVSGNVVLADIESASNNDWDDSGSYEGINIGGATNVTLKNASKTASTAIGGNSGNGLSITSTGSVSITGINAWSNGGHGVYVSNRVWPYGKPVTLTRVETGDNAGHGIYVYTAGSVSMQDIFTVENSGHGLQIDACVTDPGGCLNLANVTLKGGNNAFSNNGGAGLDISTKGSVTLSHVDVYGNDAGGVKIFNALNGTSAVTIGGKTSSKIDANTGYGLWVESHGAITLKNLVVQNTVDFVSNAPGAVYLTNKGPAKLGVSLTDVVIANNEQTGLFINTDGLVSLLGVISNDNSITSDWIDEDSGTNGVRERLSGNWENNVDRWHFIGESGDTYTITLTSSAFTPILALEDEYGVEQFIDLNSDGDGTAVLSFSLITGGEYILRVEAAGWGMGVYQLTFGGLIKDFNIHGALISTPASVKVSSSKAIFSNFSGNNGDGLYINVDSASNNSVTLTNISAENNTYNGVEIYAPKGNVRLGNNHARISAFSGNGFHGVNIDNGGTIALNNRLMAMGNGQHGFYLDNHGALTPKTITIKNVQAWFNGSTGLAAQSLGNISITNLDASTNFQNGTSLNTLGNVVVTGSNVFSGNHEQGLNVVASGMVSINGLLVEGNDSNGLDIEANGIGKTVLVKNAVLRLNWDTGLKVDAQGAITLDNVQSVLNMGSGVDLNDTGVAVLIKNSVMMGNDEYGIKAEEALLTLVNTYYFGNTLGALELY